MGGSKDLVDSSQLRFFHHWTISPFRTLHHHPVHLLVRSDSLELHQEACSYSSYTANGAAAAAVGGDAVVSISSSESSNVILFFAAPGDCDCCLDHDCCCDSPAAGEEGNETPPGLRMTLRTTKLLADPEGLIPPPPAELAEDFRERVVLKLVSNVK